MNAPTVEPWFRAEIERGLSALAVLSLDGTPAGELLERGAVAAAWAGALFPTRAWDAERDRPRMRQAFRTLAATSTRWPAPAQFVAALPGVRPAVALPAPRDPAREALARTVLERLGASLGFIPGSARRVRGSGACDA